MHTSIASVYPATLRINALKKYAILLANMARFNTLHHRQSTLLMALPLWVRRRIWNRVANPAFTPLPLSEDMARSLAELRQNGIVKLEQNFGSVADYLLNRHFTAGNELPADSPLRKHGLVLSQSLAFTDEALADVLFNPGICALLYNYYAAQPYYRDNPTITREVIRDDAKPLISGIFHSDGFHQISFMLLLNDLEMSDLHMEYAAGSHRELQPSYSRKEIDQQRVEAEFPLIHVIGKKGSLFIFDTEGLHRRSYRNHTARSVFHVNVTPGVYRFTDAKYESLSAVFGQRKLPDYVKNFMAKAVRSLQ